MKKNKISKDWIRKQKKDPFFQKSKIEGYRSRSAFKLLEMNKKFNFLNTHQAVLDLGCCPGGWSQVLSKTIKHGNILSVDIKSMEKINNVNFLKGDFTDLKILEKIAVYFNNTTDAVLSDIAINTTGNKSLDSYRTGVLCLASMDLAIKILSKNGIFLSKLFMGSIFKEINETAKKTFKKVIKYKPLSSKKESKEIYIYCKGVLKI